MKKIIQLSETDYKELTDLAELNRQKINKRAVDLYHKKGVHAIELKLKPTTFDNKFKIEPSASFQDWDSFYPTEYGDKKKFLKVLEDVTFDVLENQFGDIIFEINEVKRLSKDLEFKQKLYNTITFTGWGLAVFMLIIFLAT